MNKMNQTQTRSPRKRLLSLILAVILMIGLLPISAFATSASAQAGEDKAATQDSEFLRIFHLDCGRKYFTVSEIEGIIDQLAENHFTHLQLAFGNDGLRFLLDDMSLTVNGTKYDSEKVTSAIKYGNQQYYNAGSKNELTQSEMDTIIAYAKDKGISIIPMFNAPYHVNALLTAMESKLNITDARKTFAIKGDDGKITYKDTYLNLESQDAVAFVKALQSKYAAYFAGKGSTYFNFGADEYYFKGLDNALYTKFATFVNALAGIVKNNKMIPMAYNDGFYFSGLTLQDNVEFDTDIRICYWAEDGGRASAETLAGEGFQIINNSNNWYYVLGDYLYKAWGETSGQWGYYDALKGLQNTKVLQVKGDDNGAVTPIGSVLCCWCDYPSVSYTGYGYKATNQTNKESVYNLIAEMATRNPDYFKETKPELSVGTAQGVTVSAAKDGNYQVILPENGSGTVQLSVKNLADGQTAVWASNEETIAAVNANGLVTFTGTTGTVTITATVPSAAGTESAAALLSNTNDNGTATYSVTFEVKAAGELPVEEITVQQGRTYDVTLDGFVGTPVVDQDLTDGNGNVIAKYTLAQEAKTAYTFTKVSSISGGTSYYIQTSDGQYVDIAGDTTTDLSQAAQWKWNSYSDSFGYFTSTENGSKYLVYDSSNKKLTTGSNSGTNNYYWISVSGSSLKMYDGSGYNISLTAGNRTGDGTAADTTTVTFKGLKVGTTSVTIGDTIYRITVTEKKNVEIPISIIDYRADGLLFDWSYDKDSTYADSYRYGLVHGKALYWGSALSGYSYETGTLNTNTGLYEASSTIEHIEGTTYQKTGSVFRYTDFYPNSTDNDWSRAGLVQEKLGSNGMPVYTDAAVKYVASLLAKGYYNDVSDSKYRCNTLLKETFLTEGASRNVLASRAPTDFSENFRNAKTYANISNAYDLAWYLLNTIYQADTNMTTVTGADAKEHSVPIYGMAVDAYKSIILSDDGNGTYSFEAGYSNVAGHVNYDRVKEAIYEDTTIDANYGFYPLENLGYEQPGLLTNTSRNDGLDKTTGRNRNGGFTLRGESQFVYSKDSDLYFTFTGDDDVYMYINGVLALDLGGAHGQNTKTVELNKLDATKYGLVEGQVATFTFFYMERCSDASTFGIKTNMELVQREINVEKKAYDTSYVNEYVDGTAVINGTTVAYDLIVTNKSNSPMTQIKLTDTDSLGGNVTIGSGANASPVVKPGTSNDKGTVELGENGYVLFITDSNGVEVKDSSKSLNSLKALSDEIAKLTLPAGQSLHVRFLTATTAIEPSKILDYTNTVKVSATVGGQALSDTASHELYSYNANDTGRTYVVDFGLPLKIDGIFDEGAANNIGEVSLSPNNVQKYGTVTSEFNGYETVLIYTLKANTTINEPETITLDVVYKIGDNKIKLEKTLTIIPASNVYYEDSLASFTNGSGVAENAKWSTVGNDDQTTTEDGGSDVYQALQRLGDKAIYGNDDAYNSSSKLSMGTAHKVTVTSEMLAKWEKDDTTSAWPTASFTFTGTGFDVISLTDNTSGAILVKVTGAGADNSSYSKNYLVNNYYGYKQVKNDDGSISWVVSDSKEPNALYQIPVMKVDVPYGAYNVTIQVFYNQIFDKTGNTQYNFWLDAIRVYNPMGENGNSYYTQDNEGYPQYIKLHDALADGTAKPDGKTDKMVFIDGGSTADIATYANYGPNNEVYLMKGQAITFKIPQNANVDSIQIGAKAPKGTANLNVNSEDIASSLSTATEMYYDITTQAVKGGYQVTITNNTTTTDNILSLTNLKITYKIKPAENEKVTLAALDTQEQENAVNLVRALFTAPVATFSPETFEADWGRAVRAGKRATLTVKTSADVESITVDGQSITSYTTRTQRTGWGWWSPKVTYHVFTYTTTAPAQTTDYAVCAVNAEGTASEAVTATLTVRPATWWNWWF